MCFCWKRKAEMMDSREAAHFGWKKKPILGFTREGIVR